MKIRHNYYHVPNFLGNVDITIDKKRGNLEIKTRLKQDGEYALVVKGRNKKDSSGYWNVMNYIVTTFDNGESKTSYGASFVALSFMQKVFCSQ